jgi:hypothetical protein
VREVRKGGAVSGPDRSPWFIVSAFDAQGVEVLAELRQGTGRAYRLRDALLAEVGVAVVTVETVSESYGGTA